MEVIPGLLNELYTIREKITEVTKQLQDKEPILFELLTALQERENYTELKIKQKARFIAKPHTIRGKHLQLIWNTRVNWDSEKLVDLVNRYNIPIIEFDQCKSITGFYSIKRVAKEKI